MKKVVVAAVAVLAVLSVAGCSDMGKGKSAAAGSDEGLRPSFYQNFKKGRFTPAFLRFQKAKYLPRR